MDGTLPERRTDMKVEIIMHIISIYIRLFSTVFPCCSGTMCYICTAFNKFSHYLLLIADLLEQ